MDDVDDPSGRLGWRAQHMRELLTQFGSIHAEVRVNLDDPASAILDIDRQVLARQRGMTPDETKQFGVPLAGNLIPWDRYRSG